MPFDKFTFRIIDVDLVAVKSTLNDVINVNGGATSILE